MYRAKKPLLSNLNEHLTCYLCRGYFVDATTVIECLHTFCRSCIVKYLETTKYCPICDVQVHKSKPLLSLRSDKIIQDLIYKLVPRLFNNELQKRKEFYKKHPDAKPSVLEGDMESSYSSILIPEEELCITLNYYGSASKPRYLRCPSAVSMMHLQKLIRAKFDLSDSHHVDILHNQDCLSPCYTLMDIIYIYKLSRLEPLDLTYRIYEYMAKKMKLEHKESKSVAQTEIAAQSTFPNNNNNWKEVQLRISENGEMSITGIQDSDVPQNFTPEMIEVLDAKSPASVANAATNPPKKKDLPDLKFIGRSTQSSSNIKILNNETIIGPYSTQNNFFDTLTSGVGRKGFCKPATLGVAGNKDVCDAASTVTVPCMNAATTTTTVFSTINSTKCSVGTTETTSKDVSNVDAEKSREITKENVKITRNEVNSSDRGVKRKGELFNSVGPKKLNSLVGGNQDVKTSITQPVVLNVKVAPPKATDVKVAPPKATDVKVAPPKATDVKCHTSNHVNNDEARENQGGVKKNTKQDSTERKIALNSCEIVAAKSENGGEPRQKTKVPVDGRNTPKTELKNNATPNETGPGNVVNNISKHNENVTDSKTNYIGKNLSNCSPAAPKPSTKYQGPTQPCYMPKTVYNPLVNVPKPQQSTGTSKCEPKTQSKSVMNSRNENKANLAPSSCAGNVATTSLNTITVTNSKINVTSKPKSNAPLGYKTLRDPPKSWNSQISKANLTKPPPDPKYSDSKNARPAKFFKMRNNNMLRFLGNPASGVKPMYSVHVSPEVEKPHEKVVENREIKKHSIVKIDPKTLKPISEKAPETSSLSSQVSATTDLKINTSSVSIFNPLKLQTISPKSDRKSPKSPQSPKTKTTSSPSPPVHKRDKPNLNFTPANPFVPNLSSQTINPNQFLCNSGSTGFSSYDPRVMAAAYHNLFHGPLMGFPPSPLPYHLGGMDINQRTKGFDISKFVAMQQQQQNSGKGFVSPQGNAKLDAPPVPPQVPYQPRPSPMSLKPPSAGAGPAAASKRTAHKDAAKNEKSLKNAVAKLTLSRAKEIHRATEILNRSLAAAATRDEKTTGGGGVDAGREATRTRPSIEHKPSENPNAKPTAEDTPTPEVDDNSKQDKPSLLSQANEKGRKSLTDRPKSDEGVETKNDKPETPPPPCTKDLPGAEPPPASKKTASADAEKDNRTVREQAVASETLGTSEDSKNCNDNNNEATKEAGSDRLEGVTGNE